MDNSNFYAQRMISGGVFAGTTLIQAHGDVGGARYVFVKLQGNAKSSMTFPTVGGVVVNPFKGNAKIFAGDLLEYNPGITEDVGATVKIIKTYAVAKATTGATDTEILIERNGYRHIPFVGDIIMAAPSKLTGTGTGATVTAVEKATDDTAGDVWKLTLSGAIGALKQGDVLVEATSADAKATPVVTNPNTYAMCDYDFIFNPAASDDDFEGARYLMTPCLASPSTILYADRMSPLPPAVKALNKSLVPGWFCLY